MKSVVVAEAVLIDEIVEDGVIDLLIKVISN